MGQQQAQSRLRPDAPLDGVESCHLACHPATPSQMQAELARVEGVLEGQTGLEKR